MGFSPGEFWSMDKDGLREYHWEAKDSQVNLWNANESKAILRLTYDEAMEAFRQLRTAIASHTGQDPA